MSAIFLTRFLCSRVCACVYIFAVLYMYTSTSTPNTHNVSFAVHENEIKKTPLKKQNQKKKKAICNQDGLASKSEAILLFASIYVLFFPCDIIFIFFSAALFAAR